MDESFVALIWLQLGHVICAGIGMFDLLFISKRKMKLLWSACLLLLPFIGLFIYMVTKKTGPGSPPPRVRPTAV